MLVNVAKTEAEVNTEGNATETKIAPKVQKEAAMATPSSATEGQLILNVVAAITGILDVFEFN